MTLIHYRVGILAEIANLIGGEHSDAICREYHNSTLYLPENPNEKHKICGLIGVENTKTLVAHFEASHICIPLGHMGGVAARRAKIQALNSQNLTNAEIARRLGVSLTTVYRHLQANRDNDDSDQLQLPFE